MRAIVVEEFGPYDQAVLGDRPDPRPGPGEVLVETRAVGLSYPDILVVTGRYQVKPPLPFVPGKELAGVVAALGEGVGDLAVGQRVAVQVEYGACAERVVARRDACFPLPDGLDFADAVALGLPVQTAWFALKERAGFRLGETVLVNGASGAVGLAAIQLVKAWGGTALAGVTHQSKIPLVEAAGADHVIDQVDGELRERLRDRVCAVTDGRGADICIDTIGGDVFDASLRALAWKGRLVVVGFASGVLPTVRANYLLLKNIAVLGLNWADYRDRAAEQVAEAQAEIFALAAAGRLKPPIMKRLPLDGFAEGLRLIDSRRALGRVVLEVA